MIVLGADAHKCSHTVAAIAATTGELRGEQAVQVGVRGFDALLRWARGLDDERVWTLEDCRHVSGGLERFLIARGERVLRIPTHLSATARRSSRQRGKSDPIDAVGVARVALQEGPWVVAGRALGRARARSAAAGRSPRTPGLSPRRPQQHAAMASARPLARAAAARQLAVLRPLGAPDRPPSRARGADDARPRRPRRAAAHPRALPHAIKALEAEIAQLVAQIAPQLLTEPGFGPLTAAKLVGEIAGAQRFATPAKLARAAGVAPIPASSGNTQRQRLDQGGNRQINAALHRVIVTRARCHPETRDYLARRQAEGKTTREAIRCLKRYLARQVWRLLQPPHPGQGTPPSPSIS